MFFPILHQPTSFPNQYHLFQLNTKFRLTITPKMLLCRIQTIFTFSLTFFCFPKLPVADECPPVTWSKDAPFPDFAAMSGTPTISTRSASPGSSSDGRITYREVKPGELNCRAWAETYGQVSFCTCAGICDMYGITMDRFFSLNPTLKKDYSDIHPNSRYCYDGCKFSNLMS